MAEHLLNLGVIAFARLILFMPWKALSLRRKVILMPTRWKYWMLGVGWIPEQERHFAAAFCGSWLMVMRYLYCIDELYSLPHPTGQGYGRWTSICACIFMLYSPHFSWYGTCYWKITEILTFLVGMYTEFRYWKHRSRCSWTTHTRSFSQVTAAWCLWGNSVPC